MIVNLAGLDDPRWQELSKRAPASLFHAMPWAQVLADTYGFSVEALAVANDDGTLAAGVPFVRVADLLGERVVSLPFSDYSGVIGGGDREARMLIEGLAGFGVPVTLRCLGTPELAALVGVNVTPRACWHAVDIDREPDALRARFAPATRRALRKAERCGVVVETPAEETFLAEFFRLHLGVRKRKYRLFTQPPAFFAAIARRLTEAAGWFPRFARHEGRVVAATLYLRLGDVLYYKFNASEPWGLAERPNDLLMWEGIRLAASLGCRRLDLGASDFDQPGLIRFKRGFGAIADTVVSVRWTPAGWRDERTERLGRVLGRMTELFTDPAVPDAITDQAGRELYRYFA